MRMRRSDIRESGATQREAATRGLRVMADYFQENNIFSQKCDLEWSFFHRLGSPVHFSVPCVIPHLRSIQSEIQPKG